MNTLETSVDPPLVERSVTGLHAALVARIPQAPVVGRVVDVGCGTGAWLARLRKLGYGNLCGIDLDTSQFAAVGIDCARGDLDCEELPVAPGSVGLMTAIELVEHLHNPGRLFHHAARLLTPEGVLLVTTPNVESVLARLRFLLTGKLKQFDDKGDPTHVSPIVSVCLERLVACYGLKIIRAWGYPDTRNSPTSRRGLNLLASIARPWVPESHPGDVSCFLIARARAFTDGDAAIRTRSPDKTADTQRT